MKLGLQTQLGAQSQIYVTIQLVPKPWKVLIIIPPRRRGTCKGVPVATWCSEWICKMRGGLVRRISIIPAALTLPLLRGAAVGRAPTIFQNGWFCTRISIFSNLQFFRLRLQLFRLLATCRFQSSWTFASQVRKKRRLVLGTFLCEPIHSENIWETIFLISPNFQIWYQYICFVCMFEKIGQIIAVCDSPNS